MASRSGSASKSGNSRGRLNRKSISVDETEANPEGNEGRFNRKDKSTAETPTNREGKYNYWIPRKTEILLKLVNAELEAKDYAIRLPDNPGKRRIEEKYYEMTGDKIVFYPEMSNRLDYMRRLRYHYNLLLERTGIHVNPMGQIEMSQSWWDDRIAEAGKNGKFVKVLQSKPLPFKELLDQIYGEHDLDQDVRFSPFMLGEHIQQTQVEEASDDEIAVGETADDNGIQVAFEPMNLRVSDDEVPTREQVQCSPPHANRSSMCVRSAPTKRTNRRRVNFETQIQSGFQRMEESRTSLLDVFRSRHHQKATFGDALAVLETLEIEPMGKFWWAANGLLMNDEDIRDGFMKLRSEENKIRYLERLIGVDRFGDPCQIINLRETSNIPTSSIAVSHSHMAGFNTSASTSFGPGLGMFETTSSATSFTSLLGVLPPSSIGLSSGYGSHLA
ncbi:unnamed protein product [Microthlaspi erraticum]|uniref:Myb/SANT-like domain-containing protein n=1 Tax=Microthlaspi erraticum TaxID=1685480 RepID=A0A6D2JNM9_9BRAS|nr:unnamed protein product [Microthlaspi erraticum]